MYNLFIDTSGNYLFAREQRREKGFVLESSFIAHKLWFCARGFLALIPKILIFGGTFMDNSQKVPQSQKLRAPRVEQSKKLTEMAAGKALFELTAA